MNKNINTAIGIGAALVVIGFLFYGNAFMSLFNTNTQEFNVTTTPEVPMGFKSEDIVPGTGPIAAPGDMITVHYIGTLTDGKVFDSSRDRGEPFSLVLGRGDVIRGWDEGLVGMKVGGTRRLTISPEYGYGSRAIGPIPANSVLVFTVELLGVEKPQQ